VKDSGSSWLRDHVHERRLALLAHNTHSLLENRPQFSGIGDWSETLHAKRARQRCEISIRR
jgi:hypothetical protein